MHLIGQAHTLVHQNGVVRIQSDIRVGTRTDKKQHFAEKVSKVESILAADVTGRGNIMKVEQQPIDAEGNSGKVDTVKLTPAQEQGKAIEESKEPHKGTWASMFKPK
jgi:hypothetical protein